MSSLNDRHEMSARELALALLFLLAVLTPARAALFCEIPKARDGFIALRAAPDGNARVVFRRRAGDEVMLLQGERGPWLEVKHWRGDSRLDPKKSPAETRQGWVHNRYIGECG